MYKASGGKMVYNDTLKREIPDGWDLIPLEYFADVIDPHPSHRAPKEVEHGFPFAGIGDIDESGNIAISKARKIDEEFVDKQERLCNWRLLFRLWEGWNCWESSSLKKAEVSLCLITNSICN